MRQKDYSKKRKCPDCGRPISNRAKKCGSCAKKLPKSGEEGSSRLLLAWRYDCQCGITAYAFEPHPEIRDSEGHSVRRGARVIYFGGKFHNPCPSCGQRADDHTYELKDETFYVALCPSKS